MPGAPFFSLLGVLAPVARSIPCLESALAEPAPCGSVRRTCDVGMCGIFLVHYRLERCLGKIRETPADLLDKLEHRERALWQRAQGGFCFRLFFLDERGFRSEAASFPSLPYITIRETIVRIKQYSTECDNITFSAVLRRDTDAAELHSEQLDVLS